VSAHLAQINLGTMVAPVEDPEVAEFMAALDAVNLVADEAPGFVWRLQDDNGNATSIHLFADPLALVNMSVWESVDSLRDYVYRTTHVEYFRRRAEWFRADGKRVALWWVPAGTVPDVRDGVRLVLETGIRQESALALYRTAGFEPAALWGEYLASPETSRCFAKPLG
jgi:hypothetical protein